MGRLRVRGELKLDQFWPKGRSDADTANLTLSLTLDPPFVYRPENGAEQVTDVYHNAFYKDRSELKPVLGTKRDRLKVRLQGIDAPELHYRPRVTGAKQWRQRLAESAVFALRSMLFDLTFGVRDKSLRADAISFVDSPDDPFDVYGRYVGNVTVYADGYAVDINHWLLEHGWAVPGLYNSMTERELHVTRSLSAAAARSRLGLYRSRYYQDRLIRFESTLVERHGIEPGNFRLYEDKGKVMNPKFFRRQAEFEAKEQGNPSGQTFLESLRGNARYKALVWETFAGLPAQARRDPRALGGHAALLGSLVSSSGKLPRADDLIYIEEPAKVYDEDGQVITAWNLHSPRRRRKKRPAKKRAVQG